MDRRLALAPLALGGLLLALPLMAAAPVKDAPSVNSASLAISRYKCGGRQGCPFGAAAGTVWEGLNWGMTHDQVIQQFNRPNGVFDQLYNPELAKMQPGSQMQAKEAERDDRKRAFVNSYIEFKNTPTGYDASAIRAEYTYRNKESIMSIDDGPRHRFFFFIGAPPAERLWKVYEEVPLGDGSPLGKTFADAVTSINVYVAAQGRTRGADASQGILSTTVDWQDAKSHLRAIDRSREGLIGIVLEDRQILGSLPQLRSSKADDPFAMDPSVRAITAGSISDPNAEQHADAGARRRK